MNGGARRPAAQATGISCGFCGRWGDGRCAPGHRDTGRRAAGYQPPGWRLFADGWWCCPHCQVGAVRTQQDARRLLPSVRAEMAALGVRLPAPVRIRIVSAGQGATSASPRVAGLLLGLTRQEVTDPGRQTRVTAIEIVSGLPPTHFGRTVAHEMGHAWLALNGRVPPEPTISEGVCELFAYAWLKRRTDPVSAAARAALVANPDPIYGDGFRLVRSAVRWHGIRQVLAKILLTGRLP
ncbi:protein DA1 [Solwaraspora sp. WMMB335]|uniref:protein DA1 n=1 Tax=Solwaraspora sp. WMMB335 TaxID=3404118 RepID=UPI003B95499E